MITTITLLARLDGLVADFVSGKLIVEQTTHHSREKGTYHEWRLVRK